MQPYIEQPEFLLEPKSSYIFENHPIQLQCKAIRTRQIFFNCENKWLAEQEHNKSTETNEKGQIIIITTIQLTSEQVESNSSKCFCQAWSATGGTLKSRPATIELAYLDKLFEWEPLKTDGVMSKSAELRCRPPTGNPYPKITWLKDNQPVEINRNGRLILSNENSLLIAQVRKSDAGNYTCVASNIAGSYSSEPAELIVHDDRGWAEWQPFSECKGIPCTTGRQRRIRTCLNPPTITNRPSCDGDQMQERECPVPCIKDSMSSLSTGTEVSEWSECAGIPCQIGKQKRVQQCSPTSKCDEERNCFVPCSNQNQSTSIVLPKSEGIYSNWTDWSACQSPNCTSIRTRQCLREPCRDYLIENRPCECSSALISSSVLNVLVYSSAGIGVLIFLLLTILCMIIYYRRRRHRMTKKGLSACISSQTTCNGCHIERHDYPFYYTIQQDTTSTRSNNSITLTNSDLGIEREKVILLNESPLRSSNQFNRLYENILQTLPEHTDLRYFAVSVLNNKGCHLEIPHTGIALTIPEDAVLLDEDHLIFLALLYTENHMPILNSRQTRLSPVILIGPSNITLVKPAVLTFGHTAVFDTSWKFHVMFTDDILHWKSILTYGQENISTPVYLQFNDKQQAFLLFETLGAYTLIGESNFNAHVSKYVQMACFYNPSSIRIRFFDKTSDAYERCLNEEMQLENSLCDQAHDILLSDLDDQICLNVDFECSTLTRMNIGYKDIPLQSFWTNHVHRSCFIFLLPSNDLTKIYRDQFAVHINVYQPKILENALHTRMLINTLQVGGNSMLRQRYYSKSSEKIVRLPKMIREKLCQILDPPTSVGNDWRMFASHLLGINYPQYFASKSSPTEHLLTLWDARHESLVQLINVLNQIGRSDAACIILAEMNVTH